MTKIHLDSHVIDTTSDYDAGYMDALQALSSLEDTDRDILQEILADPRPHALRVAQEQASTHEELTGSAIDIDEFADGWVAYSLEYATQGSEG